MNWRQFFHNLNSVNDKPTPPVTPPLLAVIPNHEGMQVDDLHRLLGPEPVAPEVSTEQKNVEAEPSVEIAVPETPALEAVKENTKMSWFSTIVSVAVTDIKGFFAKQIPTLKADAQGEWAQVESSLITFAKTDLGKLAIDCVNGVPAALAGGVGGPAFQAAKTQFITDAKTAGHDLEKIGAGVVDWFVQTAYTVVAGVASQAESK